MANEKMFEAKLCGFKSVTPGMGKSFLQFKLILSILFFVCLGHEFLYTYLTTKYFRGQINERTTRSGIQVLKTHAHFFTLSGLWSGVCLLVGFYSIIMEHFGFIIGYSTMAFGGLVFQFMGSLSSRDSNVIKLTAIGSIHEPIMILVSLLFAHTIKTSTKKLTTSPVYRRTMIESRFSSLTDLFTSSCQGSNPNPNIKDDNWTLTRSSGHGFSVGTSATTANKPGVAPTLNNNSVDMASAYNHAFVPEEEIEVSAI